MTSKKTMDSCCDELPFCAAPSTKSKFEQCQNRIVAQGASHCTEHQEKAKVLYVKYKRICDVAYNLDLNCDMTDWTDNEKINYLTNCHAKYRQAYLARMEHRNYAYIPSAHDFGHNKQFEIILTNIETCRTRLEELYALSSNNNGVKENGQDVVEAPIQDTVLEEKSQEKPQEENVQEKAKNKLKQFKIQQRRDEEETRFVMDLFTKQTSMINEERSKVAKLVIQIISNIAKKKQGKQIKGEEIKDDQQEKDRFILGTFVLLSELNQISFFSDDYKALPCENCRCGAYQMELLKLLPCSCPLKKFNFHAYLIDGFRVGTLKSMIKLFLHIQKYQAKLESILTDFEKLYKFFGIKLFTMQIFMTYNGKTKSFGLILNDEPLKPKPSHEKRLLRLKRKLLQKKIESGEIDLDE